MKKHAKRLSIILTLALILTSFEFLSVFAVDTYTITWVVGDKSITTPVEAGDVPVYPNETPTKPDQGDSSYTFDGWEPKPVAATADATYTAKFTETTNKKPAKVDLKTYSSYNSVWLEWTEVDNPNTDGKFAGKAVSYSVLRDGVALDSRYIEKITIDGKPGYRYHVTGLSSAMSPFSTNFPSYKFVVKASIKADDGTTKESSSDVKADSPVRSMRYRITIKRSGTLKSHSGRKQKYKVKKGQVIYADRFQTGKYIFDYNGSTFYVARTRVGKKAAEYVGAGGWNYSPKEAEYYVRDRGLSSGTGVLVWVNTYTQHVYYFNRGAAGWTCADNWECSTGTASTPTPSGTNGMKAIKKKIKKKNGIKWWSTFNGNAALHGRKKNKPVGNVASNGCVRNPDGKAYTIFSYAGKGTRVMIY